MTVIAVRGRTMAADSQSEWDIEIKTFARDKIVAHNGWLIGISGTRVPNESTFIPWFFNGLNSKPIDYRREPLEGFDFEALLLSPEGDIWLVEEKTGNVANIPLTFWASGSGAAVAMGAMWYGASAADAAKAAIELSPGCGGAVVEKSN